MKNEKNTDTRVCNFDYVAPEQLPKKGLPEYENWDLNNIDNVYVEYRYESGKVLNDKPVVAYQRLNVQKNVVANSNTIELTVEVPAASGTFTDEIRSKVMQNYLWMYMDVSTAAKVTQLEMHRNWVIRQIGLRNGNIRSLLPMEMLKHDH